MTVKELVEYLSGFEPDGGVAVADLDKRICHKISAYNFLTDTEKPALLLETDGSFPMDEVLEEQEGDNAR